MDQPWRKFYFRLALALGMTVQQLLSEISSAELTEWMAYYRLEPWGSLMDDKRHGIATAALANVHRDSKRRRDPFRPEDFIPWHERRHQPEADSGELLDDPEAQSQLILRRVFGKK